jgi:hypothetical protein
MLCCVRVPFFVAFGGCLNGAGFGRRCDDDGSVGERDARVHALEANWDSHAADGKVRSVSVLRISVHGDGDFEIAVVNVVIIVFRIACCSSSFFVIVVRARLRPILAGTRLRPLDELTFVLLRALRPPLLLAA